ncbi:DUF2262 domain-containing protein [Deinococcus apachensis]|uniref:DUF2262 domain-containing protein n=1 Tax=Deinococcus apachensis TaxID=309886 RepID=UPI000364A223|nr:DUF2262 domain-containing protein [Deinococcus apachensis]
MSGPDSVHVPGLGTFRHEVDRSYGGPVGGPYGELVLVSWEAELDRRGEQVKLSLYEDGSPLSPEEVTRAGQRMLAFLEREESARREVATALLDLAGDWWAARGDEVSETPLTVETFLGLMRLEAVVAEEEDQLTVYYDDDGEVFAGHAIQAVFGVDGTLINTDIPG